MIKKKYYNVDESYEILGRFLKAQIAFNKITIFDFVHFLKSSGKRNCLYIEGRSNSGKTWFSNILQEFMLNAGFISNWNRYHQFPLQDCLHRNLLVFDEPNIEPSSFETWKNILAGNNQAINVKYRTNSLLLRTPVLVLANNYVFPRNEEFNSMIFHVNFTETNTIHNLRKKLDPRCIILLFDEYLNSLNSSEYALSSSSSDSD